MKTLFFLLILVSFHSHAQKCARAVDQKRVVLFLDTNKGAAEVATARAAACQRGESFVMVSNPDEQTVRTALDQIKARGAKPVSLVISGHDGGGSFSGESGSISRADLTRIFNDSYPEFKPSLESLYLLGCYTGVKFEVFSWMSTFPNMRLIGGYEGSAPLSSRPAGHDYIRSLMLQERTLASSADAARLKASLERIPNMSSLNSAVVVRADHCVDESNNPKDFYFRPKATGDERFQVLDSKDCVEKIKQIKGNVAEFVKYYDGIQPVPTDTTAGPLRKIYNFFRGAEHCMAEQEGVPSGDQVLSLLFYPGFAENFTLWNESEARSIQSDLNALTLAGWTQQLERDAAHYDSMLAQLDREIARSETSEPAMKAEIDQKLNQLKSELERMSKTPEGRRLEAFFNSHPGLSLADLPVSQFSESFTSSLVSMLGEMSELSQRKELIEDSPLKEVLANERNMLVMRKEEIAGIPRTQEALDKMKKEIWLPTPENVIGKTREDHRKGVHQLYQTAQFSPGIPGPLRQRIRALSHATTNQLNNLRCMPLSWHETNHQRPREAPACGNPSASRFSTDAAPKYDMTSWEQTFDELD